MTTATAQTCAPPVAADQRVAGIVGRFIELRDCQARYAEFTLGLFDQFERIGDALAKNTANDNQLERAEMETMQLRLAEVESSLQATQAELVQERESTASEKVSLDDETRDFLDDLVRERDALRAQLESLQTVTEEQKSGYESEVDLLRNQLSDSNQQVIKLREKQNSAKPSVAETAVTTPITGDVSSAAEAIQAPCEPAETSPILHEASAAGADLESLMNQVRMLQQDVARRRGKSAAK